MSDSSGEEAGTISGDKSGGNSPLRRWLDPAGMIVSLPLALWAGSLPGVFSWLVVGILVMLMAMRLRKLRGRLGLDCLSLPVWLLVVVCVPLAVWVAQFVQAAPVAWARAVLLLWCLGLFSWVANDTGSLRWKLGTWMRCLVILAAVTAGVGLVGLGSDAALPEVLDWLRWLPESMTGPGGIPTNELAGTLLLFLGPAVAIALLPAPLLPVPRSVAVFVVILLVVVLAATRSRGGLLGAVVSLACLASMLGKGNTRWQLATVLAVAAGGCAIAALWMVPAARIFVLGGTLQGASLETFFSGRFAIWQAALGVLGDLPLTGVGLGSFGGLMDTSELTGVPVPRHLEDAHQQFLQAGTDFGIVGGVCWLWIWSTLCVMLVKLRRRLRSGKLPWFMAAGLLSGLLGHLMFNLVDSVSPGWPGGIGFWLIAGLAVRMRRQVMGASASRRWLPLGSAPVVAGVALALLVSVINRTGLREHLETLRLHAYLAGADVQIPEVPEDASPGLLWLSGLAADRSGDDGMRDRQWLELVKRSPGHRRLVRARRPLDQALAEAALHADEIDADACFWLSAVLEEKDPERSFALLRRGLALDPKAAVEWLRLGESLMRDGATADREEALVAFGNACLHGDPGANGCVRAGALAEELGRTDDALRFYRRSHWHVGRERALALDPQGGEWPRSAFVWAGLAVLLLVAAAGCTWSGSVVARHGSPRGPLRRNKADIRDNRSRRASPPRNSGGYVTRLTVVVVAAVAAVAAACWWVNRWRGSARQAVPVVAEVAALPDTVLPDARLQILSVPFAAGVSQVDLAVPGGFAATDCRRCAVLGTRLPVRRIAPDAAPGRVRVEFSAAAVSSGSLVAFFWRPGGDGTTRIREYFVAPDGAPDNDGTESSPWDLRSALEGAHSVEPGSLVWCRGGTYPGTPAGNGMERSFRVALAGNPGAPVHIGPLPGADVVIEGGLSIEAPARHLWIGGFEFYNPDPVPGGEPTPPGSIPNPLPEGFDAWGKAGIAVMSGENHVIYNNVTHGGAHAFSAWNGAPGTILLGNVCHDAGWLGEDRAHGHCIYAQNRPDMSAKVIRHNLFAVRSGRTINGNYGLHLYATGPAIGAFTVWENAVKGPVVVMSENAYCDDIQFEGNVIQALRAGPDPAGDSNGNTFGKPAQGDRRITLRHNTFINGVKRLENNGWESVSESGNRVVKTDARWWVDDIGSPPGLPVRESGTFIDYSGKGGADEFRFWPNPVDRDRAHVVIMDFDRDGRVAIDPGAFLRSGDRYRIHHYRDLTGLHAGSGAAATASGNYSGGGITLPVVEAGDTADMFVLMRNR